MSNISEQVDATAKEEKENVSVSKMTATINQDKSGYMNRNFDNVVMFGFCLEIVISNSSIRYSSI